MSNSHSLIMQVTARCPAGLRLEFVRWEAGHAAAVEGVPHCVRALICCDAPS